MDRVIFWGATGQAKVLRDALSGTDVDLLALFDNRRIASPFEGIPLFLGESGFSAWERGYRGDRPVHACVAIGGAHGADRLARMLWLDQRGYPPLSVVHPRAFLAGDVMLGRGCQVMAFGAICAGAKLGNAVIVNTRCSIDHDCIIGDGVHIAPGATLAGDVTVDAFAFIGAGSVVLPRIRIGTGATIGAGAVVTRNVAAGDTVIGNPARKYSKELS